MINIDLKNTNENVKIDGTLQTVLFQLSYLVSFVFVRMALQGYGIKQIKAVFEKVVKDGFNRGIDSLQKEIQDENKQQRKSSGEIQETNSS